MSAFSSYLDAARQGRNDWWIYVIGLCLILFSWLFIGSILTFIMFLVFGLSAGEGSSGSLADVELLLKTLPAEQTFIVINVSFIPFLLAILLVVWLAHGRSPKRLITPFARLDWRRMGLAFILWIILIAAGSLVEFLLWPETFRFSFEPSRYLAFLVLPLIFTPIQIAAEELFFRGYVLQGMGLLTRNRLVLIGLSSILFLVPHFANPEFYLGENALANFILTSLGLLVFAVSMAWATLKDQTLEVALSVHAANNLYVATLVNFEGSALPTPALVMTTHYDALFNLAALLVAVMIFAALMFGVFKQRLPEVAASAAE